MALLALILGLFFTPLAYFSVQSDPSSGVVTPRPSAPAARGTAVLTLKKVEPVAIVVGSRFKPGELVRVTGVGTKRVRASATGRFTVRFPNVDPCGGFSITAVGSRGSRAALNYSQLLCVDP